MGTEEHEARVSATAEVQAAILAEFPVSNLVTPDWHVGVSERLSEYDPWGSDYYVIRSDLFVTETEPTTAPTAAPSKKTEPTTAPTAAPGKKSVSECWRTATIILAVLA